jgi:hypothetical protein
MATMPLGVRARIDGAGKSLEVLEAAVTAPGTDGGPPEAVGATTQPVKGA